MRRVRDRLDVEVTAAARDDIDYAAEVWSLILESNGLTRELYSLDRDGSFTAGNEDDETGRRGLAFATSRMVRSATLLRDMWTTAVARGRVRAASEKLRQGIRERLFEHGIDVWVNVSLDLEVELVGRLDDPAQARLALEVARGFPTAKSVESKLQSLY